MIFVQTELIPTIANPYVGKNGLVTRQVRIDAIIRDLKECVIFKDKIYSLRRKVLIRKQTESVLRRQFSKGRRFFGQWFLKHQSIAFLEIEFSNHIGVKRRCKINEPTICLYPGVKAILRVSDYVGGRISESYWLPKSKIKYCRTGYRVTAHVVRNIQDRSTDNRKKRAALMRIRKVIKEQVTINHSEHAFKDVMLDQVATAHMINV